MTEIYTERDKCDSQKCIYFTMILFYCTPIVHRNKRWNTMHATYDVKCNQDSYIIYENIFNLICDILEYNIIISASGVWWYLASHFGITYKLFGDVRSNNYSSNINFKIPFDIFFRNTFPLVSLLIPTPF